MRVREQLQAVIEPHHLVREDAVNRWNAKFDILGRMVIAGDYVVWAASSQTRAGESMRFFKVLNTSNSARKIRVAETDDVNNYTEIEPARCMVVTDQIRHAVNNPLNLPTIGE